MRDASFAILREIGVDTGGRVCFDDMFGSGGFGNSQAQYTAIPAAGSCGRSFIDTYDNGLGQVADIAGIYGGGTSGLMKAASKNVFEVAIAPPINKLVVNVKK